MKSIFFYGLFMDENLLKEKGIEPLMQELSCLRVKKSEPAANPDAYVADLDGWRRDRVEALRNAVRTSSSLTEEIKWGPSVYSSIGPVLLIRAEPDRVLFGFWRGQRLLEIEPRLKRGGKYEMAALELHEDATIKSSVATRLTKGAVAFNEKFGDPRLAAKTTKIRKKK